MANQDLIQSLSNALIAQVGSYFENISASATTGLEALDGAGASVVVLYSANGIPMAVASSSNRREISRRMASFPGMMVRVVEVGDEALAGHLARLMGELFSLPFGIIGPERPVMSDGIAEAPRRRGRKPGSASKGGRKRGRPARVATSEDGVEAPKRRGRRPKNASADAAGATKRRGPGRPRKVEVNGEVEAPAPKKRGRPFGSKNKVKG